MSEQMNADAGQSIINYDDEPARPPPKLEVGLAGWMRQNLFSSPADIVVTIVTSLLILGLLIVTFTIINQSGQSVTGIVMVMLSYLFISLCISLLMNMVNQRYQLVTR